MKTKNTLLVFVAIIVMLGACKKDNPVPSGGYAVPTTYAFTNVNYSGQSIRLSMLDSISNYMKNGNNGMLLSANTMKNMYSNTGNPFNSSVLDGSGKQLKSKTYSLDQPYFDGLFDSLAVVSQYGANVGSNGIPGVVTSNDATKKYLLNANGVEYAQVIKKQLMGAVFYYQAIETYLANLSTKDNTTIVSGEGTVMEHNCDEAFGYLGVPVDFPTNITGLRYWGEYTNKLNSKIASSAPLMNAFLKLRSAISNKDYTTRDAQIVVVREQWERVVAASAIYELSEAKKGFADDAVRNHVLSEGVGFIYALKYNGNKKIAQTQIDAAIAALGSNFYTISVAKIDNAINIINAIYGFDLSKF